MMLAPAADASPGGSAKGRAWTPLRPATFAASSRADPAGAAGARARAVGGSGFLDECLENNAMEESRTRSTQGNRLSSQRGRVTSRACARLDAVRHTGRG